MKIYEKPMAIVNRFEVEDVIAQSVYTVGDANYDAVLAGSTSYKDEKAAQGVVFQW